MTRNPVPPKAEAPKAEAATQPLGSPTFTDKAEAVAGDVTALAHLAHGASAADAAKAVALAFAADAAAQAIGLDARIARYRTLGEMISDLTRARYNEGLATDTKGVRCDPLASDEAIDFKHVRNALGVRGAGDKFTPGEGVTPVGRSELQRYWEATTIGQSQIVAAKAKLGPKVNDASAVIVEAAKVLRRERMTPAEAQAAAEAEAAREAAKAEAKAEAKRQAEAEAEAMGGADAKPEDRPRSTISEAEAEAMTLGEMIATRDYLSGRIALRHAAEAKARKAKAQAEAEVVKMAQALGLSVEAVREMVAAKAAAEAEAEAQAPQA